MKDLLLTILVMLIGLIIIIALVRWSANDYQQSREQEKQEWLQEAREQCPCQ